jgi:hypothetical protein
MRRGLKWLLILALLGACGWAVWAMRPNEARRIRETIRQLAKDASFSPNDGNIARLAKVEGLLSRLTEDAELLMDGVGFPARSLSGRDEMREVALATRGLPEGLAVEVYDVVVTLDGDPTEARAALTVTARSGSSELIAAQEFELGLVKRDGRWLVRRIEPVRTLEK